jgi:hypothetical protein
MTEYAVVPATSAHIAELALTMRQADRDEAIAQTGIHPALALGLSVGNSDAVWAGLADGKVLCVFGVSDVGDPSGDVGAPWMLGSDLLVVHQRKFLRHCAECVEKMQTMFPVLQNHVDERNITAIRWLRWLGFVILPTEAHGPYGLPFHPFERVRK